MATDMNRLQGEIAENPQVPTLENGEDLMIEKIMIGFLRALLDEQRETTPPAVSSGVRIFESTESESDKSAPPLATTALPAEAVPAYLRLRAPSPAPSKESV